MDGIQDLTAEPDAAVLADVLQPGLRLVICGTAVGHRSAATRSYYAGPGNKFWATLHEIGLTSRRLQPRDYGQLAQWGIGLTDLAKHASGNDVDIKASAYDVAGFRERIIAAAPRAMAFNGKKAAGVYYGRPTEQLTFGRQPDTLGDTAIYILPSTSGAASGYWAPAHWQSVAQDLSAGL